LSKTDPAEETSFLRSVRGTSSAISPGPKPGRDLVLTCSPTPSFQLPGDVPGFFISNHIVVLTVHGILAGDVLRCSAWRGSERCGNGYRFPKPQGKPNPANARKPLRHWH